jgi:hypothetical protein
MVNGVLVERTVQDVLPTLKTNSDGLKQVLEDMLKQYKSKQSELDSWKVRVSRREDFSCLKLSLSHEPGTVLTCLPTTEEEQHPGCAALMASLFYIFVYVPLSVPGRTIKVREHETTGVTGNGKRLDIMQR